MAVLVTMEQSEEFDQRHNLDDEPAVESAEDGPVGKFIVTGQIITASFWWATGTEGDIGVNQKTVDLPAYRHVDLVQPTRYFHVPAGVVKDKSFFIDEETLAGNLLIRDEPTKATWKKVRITATRTYKKAAAVALVKKQLDEKFWDKFWFTAYDHQGDSFKIDDLAKAMLHGNDPAFAKTRTWSKFVTIISQKTPSKYDVKSRFWLPKLVTGQQKYKIYYLPTKPDIITAKDLEDAVEEAYEGLSQQDRVFDAAILDPDTQVPMIRIGHNFFGLFDTYMESSEYKRMIIASYTDDKGRCSIAENHVNDPWPVRPWFSENKAGVAAVNTIFQGEHRKKVVQHNLEPANLMAVTTQRSRGQAQVMDNTSATKIAALLWPNIVTDQHRLSPKWNCEWIHRIAHSMDGDQHKSNLLFGTSECNTDMIRVETLVRRFVLLTPLEWEKTLLTTMVDAIPDARWCQEFIPHGAAYNVPADPGRYSWTTPFLHYQFGVALPNTTEKPHWETYFDFMNRYVPLRLDVDIDDILMNQFMDWVVKKYDGKMAVEETA
ncbi:hypothetical protein BC835DRAFT_1422521 [Cytidiella melzeri]|nr:hypothetical protein BC835DRAFT_1422521 [Cytidiella melzeri]